MRRDPCPDLSALRRCEECGQPFTPFPIPDSRLCAPCVYRVLTRSGDGEARMRLGDAALHAIVATATTEPSALLAALADFPAVAHCALWERAGARLVCTCGDRPGLPPPPTMAVAALEGPTFVDELARTRPALAHRFGAWSWVTPLTDHGDLLGALALVERVEPRLRRPGDLPLLATAAAAALVILERRRRRREARALTDAVRRASMFAAGEAREIREALLLARATVEGDARAGLCEAGLAHLDHALTLCDALETALSTEGLLGDDPARTP